MQVSSDGKSWVEVPLKAKEGYMNESVSFSGLSFKDKIYVRFFQDRFSNMHVKSFEIGMKYKSN
jgi:hypothetical protein